MFRTDTAKRLARAALNTAIRLGDLVAHTRKGDTFASASCRWCDEHSQEAGTLTLCGACGTVDPDCEPVLAARLALNDAVRAVALADGLPFRDELYVFDFLVRRAEERARSHGQHNTCSVCFDTDKADAETYPLANRSSALQSA